MFTNVDEAQNGLTDLTIILSPFYQRFRCFQCYNYPLVALIGLRYKMAGFVLAKLARYSISIELTVHVQLLCMLQANKTYF